MSAIREIKYLQELRHENITEVCAGLCFRMESNRQLIDIFPSKNSLNLVLEFLDSDLEILIKDRSIIFQPADVKSWFLMLMRGLHYCHKNYVLHRVLPSLTSLTLGSQTIQLTNLPNGPSKTRGFRSSINLCGALRKTNLPSRHTLVPRSRTPPRGTKLRRRSRHLGCRVYLCRTHAPNTVPPRRQRRQPTRHDFPRPRHAK